MFALVGASLIVAPAHAATTIYQDNFTGLSTVDLGGQAPTVRPGTEVWQALAGSIDTTGGPFRANGAALAEVGGVYLPFTPTVGKIYTLSASIDRDATTPINWITVGFKVDLTGSSFTGGGMGTVLIRGDGYTPNGNSEDGNTFNGLATDGPNGAFNFDNDGVNVIDIVFNTQNANSALWTMEYFIGGTSVAGPGVAGTGNYENIKHVGFSQNNTPGTISNFSLTVIPEPSAALLGGLGSLLLLRRRR